VMLSPDVGRLQIAVVAAHRVIPILNGGRLRARIIDADVSGECGHVHAVCHGIESGAPTRTFRLTSATCWATFFRAPDRRQRFLLPVDIVDWLPEDDIVHLRSRSRHLRKRARSQGPSGDIISIRR
jgi:hypothetical protein